MQKFTLQFAVLILFNSVIIAQEEVIVGWTFPGNSAIADTGIAVNLDKEVTTMGGTSDIEFKNGFTSKAAQATGWNDGMDAKAWVVSFSTEEYSNLTLSSRQSSGGNDPGPKDYRIQISLDMGAIWIDVTDGEVTVENDWETGFVDNLVLPAICDNREEVRIRWIMASNEASGAGGDVLEGGKSKIDEIYIRADKISGVENSIVSPVVYVWPNPATSQLNIRSDVKRQNIIISDISGKTIINEYYNSYRNNLDVTSLSKGIYIFTVTNLENYNTYKQKILVH